MRKEDKLSIKMLVGSIAVTVFSFVIITPVINYVRRKVVKVTSKVEESDIEGLGPEIVKKDKLTIEKEKDSND